MRWVYDNFEKIDKEIILRFKSSFFASEEGEKMSEQIFAAIEMNLLIILLLVVGIHGGFKGKKESEKRRDVVKESVYDKEIWSRSSQIIL